MSESMIERVARAIVGPHLPVPEGSPYTLDQLREIRWRDHITEAERRAALNEARAAIEAMREPTLEQKRGLIRHRGYDPDANEETLDALGNLDIMTMGTYLKAYTAMIDAALSEQSA